MTEFCRIKKAEEREMYFSPDMIQIAFYGPSLLSFMMVEVCTHCPVYDDHPVV